KENAGGLARICLKGTGPCTRSARSLLHRRYSVIAGAGRRRRRPPQSRIANRLPVSAIRLATRRRKSSAQTIARTEPASNARPCHDAAGVPDGVAWADFGAVMRTANFHAAQNMKK